MRPPITRSPLAGLTLLVWMLVGGWLLASSLTSDDDPAAAQPLEADAPQVAGVTADASDPSGEAGEEPRLAGEELDDYLARIDAEINPSRPEAGLPAGDCLVAIRSTKIDLTRSRADLEARGVHVSAMWPASRARDEISPAVASSYRTNCSEFGPADQENFGPLQLDGYISHRGGIRFATSHEQVELRRPRIRPHAQIMEGSVGAEGDSTLTPFFMLLWTEGKRADKGNTFRMTRVPIHLTGEGASALNRALSTTAFVPGGVIGELGLSGEIRARGPVVEPDPTP